MIKAGDFKVVTDPFVNTTPEQNAYLQGLLMTLIKILLNML